MPPSAYECSQQWQPLCPGTQGAVGPTKQELRAALESEPPLAAAKNPLLGRWIPQGAAQDGSGDIASLLAGAFSGTSCAALFGQGAIEFRQGTMVSFEGGSEESLGAVSYRRRPRQIFVLPEQGLTLMQFEINGPNQVTLGEGAAKNSWCLSFGPS